MVHRDTFRSPPPAEPAAERPSKSQRKREMSALQALGESLLRLSAAELARIDLPEPLREAIAETARISSHEGRRRQLQYIGKLMRSTDVEPIRAISVTRGQHLEGRTLCGRGHTACAPPKEAL